MAAAKKKTAPKATKKVKPPKVEVVEVVEVVSEPTQLEKTEVIVWEAVPHETWNATREELLELMQFIKEKAFYQQLSPVLLLRKLEQMSWFILH